MKTTQIVIAAVLGLVLAGGGFAAGMTVGKGNAAASASQPPAGGTGGRGQGAGGAFVRGGQGANANGQQLLTGRILSVNDGSITVEVRQPGAQGASPSTNSEIVLVGANTRVVKTTETDIRTSDLKPSDQIQIVGTTDASGNVAATAIVVGGNALQQLFGGGAGGQGGGGRGATPAASPAR